jgi:hypothetical protein
MFTSAASRKPLVLLIVLGCGFAVSAHASSTTIDFNGISGGEGSQFTSYMEYGFTVSPVTNNWLVSQASTAIRRQGFTSLHNRTRRLRPLSR